ncbi:MAG: 4Fe-4S dicluster domain-containing protein [Salinivirgaceae bacterium]|jgi:molybdopterin-containing oxidoreductase family iron-sulfur binding subunit
MEENTNKHNSRREFLQKMGLIASGTIMGGAAMYAGFKFEKAKKSESKIKALSAEHQLIEVDGHGHHPVQDMLTELQMQGREGLKGRRWVMVIDLAKCRNARQCMKACQGAHDLRPEQHHINVLQMQDSENTAPYYMPKPCQHCDNPPCVSVCPVDATFKRDDGIVLIDNERCIGCRFCVAACPYSARIFHWHEPLKNQEYEADKERYSQLIAEGNTEEAKELEKKVTYDVELNVPQRKGTISKCLFSADRLRVGKLPYCVSACPNGVYYFGDENEDAVTNGTTKETVQLSSLLRDNAGYRLMEDLGTKPRVYYLPPKNRLFPFPEESLTNTEQHS